MSEENILMPTQFTIKECAQVVPKTTIEESQIVKIAYVADNRHLVLTIVADGAITVTMLGVSGHPNKVLNLADGDIGAFRNFESAWYKQPDGCVHLEFTVGSGVTSTVVATEDA